MTPCAPQAATTQGLGGPVLPLSCGSPSGKEFLQLLIRIFSPGIQAYSLGKKHLALLFCLFYQLLLLCLGPKGHPQRPLCTALLFMHIMGVRRKWENEWKVIGDSNAAVWSQSFRILRLPTLPSFRSLCTLSFVQLLQVNKTPNEIPSNKTTEVFKSCYKNLSSVNCYKLELNKILVNRTFCKFCKLFGI